MSSRPTVAEERAIAAGAPAEWKSFSLLARIGFFILGVICCGALSGFLFVVTRSTKGPALVAAIACFVLAEFLIGVHRFFRAGVDEAAWLSGAIALAFFFADFNSGWRTAVAMFGLAFIAAAIRLLNPLFATVGALILPIATDSASTMTACYALGAVAALALVPFPRRRPSAEHTVGALAVALPLAAYLAAKDGNFHFDPAVAAALLIYALAALILGLRFRLHAPLIALFPTLGCFAFEVRELTGMSLEARLIVWGSVLLGASIAIERLLKTPRNGFTSRQLHDDQLGDLLQLAGTVVIASHEKPPEQPPAAGPQLETGGSSFGGAGAGGDF
jgi:hypothetical protein